MSPFSPRARGFTLLECCVATIILLSGFLTVLSMYGMSHRGASLDRNHLYALSVARGVLEEIRAHPYGTSLDPAVLADVHLQGTVEGEPIDVVFHKAVRFATQAAIGLSSSDTDVATVTVTWRDTRSGGGGRTAAVQVSGGVSDEP